MPEPFMSVWVVYNRPRDFPDKYVARRWDILRGQVEPVPTVEHLTADSLDEIRRLVPPCLACLPRYDDDDASIVEVWL